MPTNSPPIHARSTSVSIYFDHQKTNERAAAGRHRGPKNHRHQMHASGVASSKA